MNRYLPLGLTVGFLALCQTASRAQVFMKHSGYKAVPLRVQNLRADVEIIGSFAITRWEMNVKMEGPGYGGWSDEGAVADFICARPRDAKVTAFSVGNGDSPLPGRVVEKAFAAPRIGFRAAKNDPLLKSGLNAGNSFRASIYPLNSWNEVTIRTTWVQVLSSTRDRTTFRLPLISLKGATTRVGQLNVKVTVRDSALQRLSSNYNLPVRTQSDTRVLSLGQKNYRVTRDLVVTVARKKAPLQSAMMVTPNATKDGGSFVLALIGNRALNNPALSWSAGGAQNTSFSAKSAWAGEVLLATGLYEGNAGQFAARFSAAGLTRDLKIVPIQNDVSRALWATQQINALSTNAQANRAQIIALSKENSIVSPFTTWLAVNDQNLKIYQRALVSSQLDPLVREYWMRVGDGKDKSARVAQIQSVVTQISRANGLNARDELYIRLGSAINYASWKGGYYGYNEIPKTRAEKRYARLITESDKYFQTLAVKNENDSTSDNSNYRIYSQRRNELGNLREKIMDEYRKPHPDYEQLKTWQYRFAQLYGSSDIDSRLYLWRGYVNARELEAQTTAAEKANDQAKLAKLQDARNLNSRNAYFTNNIGDPPIYVSAPADARQVVAVMPDGKIKTLEYNATQKRWEGNYDVPVSMRDGDYSIQILIVNADNSRKRYTMQFRVDTTAPQGSGEVLLAPHVTPEGEKPLRLEIEHGGDVARVTALLPWGEKVSLLPSTIHANTFFALTRAPREYVGKPVNVTYILVDRAHNLTTIEAQSR